MSVDFRSSLPDGPSAPDRPRPRKLPLFVFAATLGFAVLAGHAYQKASEDRDNPHGMIVTETDPAALDRIIDDRVAAVAALDPADRPLDWARASGQLGEALTVRARLDERPDDLLPALAAIDAALTLFDSGAVDQSLRADDAAQALTARHLLALLHYKRGEALSAIGVHRNDPDRLVEAVEAFRSSALGFRAMGDAGFVAMAEEEMRTAERLGGAMASRKEAYLLHVFGDLVRSKIRHFIRFCVRDVRRMLPGWVRVQMRNGAGTGGMLVVKACVGQSCEAGRA